MKTLAKETIFDLEDVAELSPEVLEFCLDYSGALQEGQNAKEIAAFYMQNDDHGFSHSQAVWNRCKQITDQSSLLWQMAVMQAGGKEIYAKKVLILASIFHDMGRFLGAKFDTHELVGADLARNIIAGSPLEASLFYAIVNHDYICQLVNGYDMPKSIMLPLSEIFRLADKTSIPADQEIRRYHQTGRRVAPDMPLFNPAISDDVRFNLRQDIIKGDELTWFLIMFALQSTDFIYGDTRDSYAYWARDKARALETVGDLCLEEEYLDGKTPVDPNEAKEVIKRFCRKYNLLLSV